MIATYDAVTCNCRSGVGKFLSERFILGTPKFKLTSKCTNSLKQAISEDSWLSRRQHLAPFFDLMIDTQLLKRNLKNNWKNQEALIQYHQLTQIYILLKMRFIIHFFNEVSDFDTHACNFDLHVIKNMNHELIEMIEIL